MAKMNTTEINGFALREIRKAKKLAVQPIADSVDVDRSYIAKIELGHVTRVSVKVFAGIVAALGVDERALSADPHVTDEAVA